MSRPDITIIVLFCITFILFAIRSIINNNTSIEGFELGRLQKQVKELDTQNMVLKERLLPLQSYQSINARADQQGFIKNSNYVYIYDKRR